MIRLLLLLVSIATTSPTTEPAHWAGLDKNEVRYVTPEGWSPFKLDNPDDLNAVYKNPAGNAAITLHATLEKQPLPNSPSIGHQLGLQILKAIRKDIVDSKGELIEEPKLEHDSRFLVRIHTKFKLSGITSERLYLYKAIGFHLVQASIDIDDVADPAQIKSNFKTTETLLLGTAPGKRGGPLPTSRPSGR